MTLKELNDDQRMQLKHDILRRRLEEKDEGVSYSYDELDNADSLYT